MQEIAVGATSGSIIRRGTGTFGSVGRVRRYYRREPKRDRRIRCNDRPSSFIFEFELTSTPARESMIRNEGRKIEINVTLKLNVLVTRTELDFVPSWDRHQPGS